MQPEDLRSASSSDCPRNAADSCKKPAEGLELARRAKKKEISATLRTARFLSDDAPDFRNESMFRVLQKVNFTEPKSENCLRPV